jgi:amino-acid N-acetyltransferase
MSASLQAAIRPSRPGDIGAILGLLEGAGLPTADVSQADRLRLWVLEEADSLLGVIALEGFGTHALLRSLIIDPGHRKRGFGRDLVARLERDARAEGVTQLTLLTETAERFFRRLGYEVVNRREVAAQVQASAEFRSLCPASALCMTKSV